MIARMVILGASGDLTGRLLLPAVAQLLEAGRLPAGLTIVGASNAEWTTDDFREHIDAELAQHASVGVSARDAVVKSLSFQPCDVTDPAALSAVIGRDRPDTLVYLALPPTPVRPRAPDPWPPRACAPATPWHREAVRHRPCLRPPAQRDHAAGLPSPTIFRIDHFLTSDLVRRVVSLRFLNRVFEPVWNAGALERVDISWLETLALEGAPATTTAPVRSRTWSRTT